MEAKRLSEVQPLSIAHKFEAIATLPEAILDTILCLLPFEEAARTCILSRDWRYKWTKIPKVVFLEDTVKELTRDIDWNSESEVARRNTKMRSKLIHAIFQVLCMRQGPIHEFTFWMTEYHTFFDIDHIILLLERNHHTVKKLTLDCFYSDDTSNGIPLSVFSFNHLTDLDLAYCAINDKPIFSGFGSHTTSLRLNQVTMCRENLLHLLSNCPSLKSLYLLVTDSEEHCLNLEKPNIVELFKCIPVIEQLTTWDHTVESFVLDLVPGDLPTSLIHLKYFCFEDMGSHNNSHNNHGFTFLAVLVKCSPNLEKIKLEIERDVDDSQDEYTFKLEEYSGVWFENLNELEIVNFRKFKPEFKFVKLILASQARSPNLKKVILLTYEVNTNEELKMLKDLLHDPRSSQVEVIVENPRKD